MHSLSVNKKHFQRRGVLTFEWMLLFVLLTIGVIGGVAAMRDSISLKFISTSQALGSLDTSYIVPEYVSENHKFTVPNQNHEHQTINMTISGTNSSTGGTN